MAGQRGDTESFLEELFRARHGLLAARTMAALAHEVYGRLTAWASVDKDATHLLHDTEDQFARIARWPTPSVSTSRV